MFGVLLKGNNNGSKKDIQLWKHLGYSRRDSFIINPNYYVLELKSMIIVEN